MLGAQIWLNLPKKDKMTEPKYGDIKQGDVPKIEDKDSTVYIISGTYNNTDGAFKGMFVNATYLDVSLHNGKEWSLNVPKEDTLFIYLISGKLYTDGQEIDARTSVLFNHGDIVNVESLASNTRFLLLHAKPLNEPISWGGPIVMNTREELKKAFDELNNGTFIKQ
jgi:redox-sensitive bicupin YhaK (pirin superfamily)